MFIEPYDVFTYCIFSIALCSLISRVGFSCFPVVLPYQLKHLVVWIADMCSLHYVELFSIPLSLSILIFINTYQLIHMLFSKHFSAMQKCYLVTVVFIHCKIKINIRTGY